MLLFAPACKVFTHRRFALRTSIAPPTPATVVDTREASHSRFRLPLKTRSPPRARAFKV